MCICGSVSEGLLCGCSVCICGSVSEGLLCGGIMCICGSLRGGYCVELVCAYVGQ